MSEETKCETNYSINNKWNTRNKHLTKHDTNDDVDFDNCVVHTVRWAFTWSALFHTCCHLTPHWLKFWVSSQPSPYHPWRTLFDSFLPFYFYLFLLFLFRLLPLLRAVLWARQPDRHGNPVLLRQQGEWGRLRRLHLPHTKLTDNCAWCTERPIRKAALDYSYKSLRTSSVPRSKTWKTVWTNFWNWWDETMRRTVLIPFPTK